MIEASLEHLAAAAHRSEKHKGLSAALFEKCQKPGASLEDFRHHRLFLGWLMAVRPVDDNEPIPTFAQLAAQA